MIITNGKISIDYNRQSRLRDISANYFIQRSRHYTKFRLVIRKCLLEKLNVVLKSDKTSHFNMYLASVIFLKNITIETHTNYEFGIKLY